MKFIMSVSFSISLWPWAVGSAEASGGLGFRNTNYFADLVSIVSGGPRPKREEGLGRVDDWQVKYKRCRVCCNLPFPELPRKIHIIQL